MKKTKYLFSFIFFLSFLRTCVIHNLDDNDYMNSYYFNSSELVDNYYLNPSLQFNKKSLDSLKNFIINFEKKFLKRGNNS